MSERPPSTSAEASDPDRITLCHKVSGEPSQWQDFPERKAEDEQSDDDVEKCGSDSENIIHTVDYKQKQVSDSALLSIPMD